MRTCLCRLLLTTCFSIVVIRAAAQEPSKPALLKPYRALLVVETRGDPASQVITDKDAFQPVAALLKAWSVPFDILRLDQQNLGAGYLFERSGAARYGVVLWLADFESYAGKNLQILSEAVQSGASLVVVNSRFADPVLENILGLKFHASYSATDPFVLGPAHFYYA